MLYRFCLWLAGKFVPHEKVVEAKWRYYPLTGFNHTYSLDKWDEENQRWVTVHNALNIKEVKARTSPDAGYKYVTTYRRLS